MFPWAGTEKAKGLFGYAEQALAILSHAADQMLRMK
jgi:hypothetical protein